MGSEGFSEMFTEPLMLCAPEVLSVLAPQGHSDYGRHCISLCGNALQNKRR